MGLFKKKADPISERAKALNTQIASLEAQIRKLDQTLQHEPPAPRLRASHSLAKSGSGAMRVAAALREPVFEPVDLRRLDAPAAHEQSREHYNDLGVRKYDLAGAWRRLREYFRPPPASNPRLVTYLVAGSIRGLRPLRYEKRIARRRCVVLLVVLGCLLWGIIAAFLRSK